MVVQEIKMIKLKDLIKEDISMSQLNQVEKHLDKIWAKVYKWIDRFALNIGKAKDRNPLLD